MNGEARTIGVLTLLKIAGALAAILYSVFQVRYFGTDREIEVFFAAQAVLYMVVSLSQSGQLAEVFLTEYIGLRERFDVTTAHRALSVLLNRVTFYVAILLVVIYFLAPMLIALFIPGFTQDDRILGTTMFRWLLPLILLLVINSILNSLLNAERIFGRTEAAGVIHSLMSLVFLLILYDQIGIWVLVLGLYAGILVQLGLTIYFIIQKKIRYSFIWSTFEFDHRSFFTVLFSTLAYKASTQFLNWAYTASISFLPQGVFAIFRYVQTLFSKVNGIFSQPISTVLFTRFSEDLQAASLKYTSLRSNIQLLQEFALLFGLIIFVSAIAGGREALSFLWYGTKFGIVEVSIAYTLLITFFLIMAFQLFYAINRKYSVAMGNARLNYSFQAAAQFISGLCAYMLIGYFQLFGIVAALLLNRLLLMPVPFLLNVRYGGAVFNPPEMNFVLRYAILLVSLPTIFYFLRNFIFKSNQLGISREADLISSLAWALIGTLVTIIFIYLSYTKRFGSILTPFRSHIDSVNEES